MIHSEAFNIRSAAKPLAAPRLIVAGATGVLGAEVLRRLAGGGGFACALVLARQPMATSAPQVSIVEVTGDLAAWQAVPAQVGVVMFEPPRLYYQRERTLFTPAPEQLLQLAQWLRRCGVHTLVVVVPHAQGRLPDAVKRGLANLDEQALAAVGFLNKTAAWMLSALSFMVPAAEQPIRPSKLAEFIAIALEQLPVGTHVASPELLWQAADQGDTHLVVKAWLNSGTVTYQTA